MRSKPLEVAYDANPSVSDAKKIGSLPQRVLIVDDNPDAARMLSILIEMCNYDHRVAFNGVTALELAEQYKPHYVFLDLAMPGIDGYSLCAQMQSLPNLKGAVFIAQTGWSDAAFIERSRQVGFSHHLVKPVSYEDIQSIINPVTSQ